MKILLDTNILIAALIARGTCHELLEHCAVRHNLYTSEFILNEVQEKLIEKFGYSPELTAETIGVLRSGMAIAKHNLEKPVCRDSDDDNILAAAVGGSCDCIITGDEDLLVLKAYEGIDILSPRDFLTKER